MKTCLAIQSLRSCTLEEAAGIARALGFSAMDLDGVMDTTLSREKILSGDPEEVQRVKALKLTAPNIHWTFAPGNLYPVINDPDPAVRADNRDQIKRLADFCHQAEIPSLLVLPGMLLPGQGVAEAHQRSAEAMHEFVEIGADAEVAIYFEPHVTSAFETPDSVRWLVQQVPEAGLVLDYSHFICQGYTQTQVEVLIPDAVHVHLRQAKSGLLQTKLEDGTINFPALFDQLREAGFDGYLCVEYVHQNYIGADNVDVLTETVKMRDLLHRYLAL